MAGASKGVARVSPPGVLTWPGLQTNFTLSVDNKEVAATWSITNLGGGVGTIDPHTGRFEAFKELRYPSARVTGTAIDGKSDPAGANIRIMLGKGLMESSGEPYLADYFGAIPCVKWDDAVGYRAAKLMWDALSQLPSVFRNLVGEVAIVRVAFLGQLGSGGMHLPLPGRVILLSDKEVRGLPSESADITPADLAFVRTFIHEMSHCALCNQAIPNLERWWACIVLGAGLASPLLLPGLFKLLTLTGIGIVPAYGVLALQFYNPLLRQIDDVTEFSQATGWVIRDPNPISLLWASKGVPPNAVTGHRFVGWMVGLHNQNEPADHAFLPQSGFYSDYSLTDVHEDFATTFAALAFGDYYTGFGAFKPRLDFMIRKRYWPKDELDLKKRKLKVDPGAAAAQWARSNGQKDPPFNEWGIWMGLYSGPRAGNPKIVTKSIGKDFSASALAEKSADQPGDSDSGDDTEAPMADGYAQDSDPDRLSAALAGVQAADKVDQGQSVYLEKAAPVVQQVQETVARMAVPIEEGSLLDFLRSADCHGDGIMPVARIETPAGLSLPGGTKVGDIFFANDLSFWIATQVRDDGGLAEMTGAPAVDADEPHFKVKALDLPYGWRPVETLRLWHKDQTPEEQAAFAKITKLWGLETAPSGRELNHAKDFLVELASALGISITGLGDLDDADILGYAGQHGLRMFLATEADPQPGDVVHGKNNLWGFVVGANPMKVLFQGGLDDGTFGEDQFAAKLHFTTGLESVSHVWPAAAFHSQ